jgi:drug/metabolite transporter (DMT)-like permease
VFWVNATTALAWIAFFYALRTIEPLLVQILFSGIGPLSVVWLDRWLPGAAGTAARSPAERRIHIGLFGALVFAAVIAVSGLSGVGSQPLPTTVLGIALAVAAGVSISASTVLSRQLNDVGVDATALVAVRFVGAILLAGALGWSSGLELAAVLSRSDAAVVLGAAVLLIVLPNYVNQVGVALASPLTVRVVLAVGPILIFLLQLVEGRLSPSPYSLACALLYGLFAVSAAVARRRCSMRSVSTSFSTVRGCRNVEV